MASAVEQPTGIEYVLTLTRDEASTLRAILSRVGGLPETTRRRYVDDIVTALSSLAHPPDTNTNDLTGTLTFM